MNTTSYRNGKKFNICKNHLDMKKVAIDFFRNDKCFILLIRKQKCGMRGI